MYSRYKNKGFTILGISLDEEKSRQAWTKAIEKNHLNWSHVSDLKGWENEAAKIYNIQAIPATFLIDKEGKILAKNIPLEKFDAMLSKLCQ